MSASAGMATAAFIVAVDAHNTAHRVECGQIMSRFDAQRSTVVERQQYAKCVELVHPDAFVMGTGDRVLLGVVLLVIAASGAFNVRREWHDGGSSNIADITEDAIFGMIGAAVVCAIVFAFAYGIHKVIA